MVAFGKGERSVQVENIRNAAEDTEGVEIPSFNYMPAAAAIGGLVIGAGLLIFLGGRY